MGPIVSDCPLREILAAFVSGELPDDEIEAVADHLLGCTSCELKLSELDQDPNTLARRLRTESTYETELFREPELQRLLSFARTLTSTAPWKDEGEAIPPAVGRYKILKLLGSGGFARVFLARDPVLHRLVAVKVPRRDRHEIHEARAAILEGAKAAVNLKHPGLVSVYDADVDDQGLCYIVMEYIDGGSLADLLRAGPCSLQRAIQLVIAIAGTVEYLHTQDIVHRDLKPANILLDPNGNPLVTDFDLSLYTLGDGGPKWRYAGTPRYMAPEQMRGESHRITGATDVWALGVILYQLITSTTPFDADNAGNNFQGALTAPSQRNPAVGADLDRICKRCLAPHVSDRYPTAGAMADDLKQVALSVDKTSFRAWPLLAPPGLRAFDSQDAQPFMELVPGSRGKDGLPDSISFWKYRIESLARRDAFPVGVLYGPSGSGKTSLVKAGLLPQLEERVTAIYVSSTPGRLDEHVTRKLVPLHSEMPVDRGLHESLLWLRELRRAHAGRKTLLVFDQFEQWLSVHHDIENSELTKAIRQCDGVRIQALLIVRDDFWMPLTRFMRSLEIDLDPQSNLKCVDLFDRKHAEHVLIALGAAYGRIPSDPKRLTDAHQAFIEGALRELETHGTVTAVHLALLVEMAKHTEWCEAAVRELTGPAGLGIQYLNRAFGDHGRPAAQFRHQQAVRAVFRRLLPEAGLGVRQNACSYDELLEVSGYREQETRFRELLSILDQGLRLITPVDPVDNACDDQKYYQLTHDFLVRPMREWLLFRQRESLRGRAEIRLAERAAAWRRTGDPRHLPLWWEWVSILLFAAQDYWSGEQREMMRRAARHHLTRGLAAIGFAVSMVIACAMIWRHGNQRNEASVQNGLVERVRDADFSQLDEALDEMVIYQPRIAPLLRSRLETLSADSAAATRIRLALLRSNDESQIGPLVKALLKSPWREFPVIRAELTPYADRVEPMLQDTAADSGKPGAERLRALLTLAIWVPAEPSFGDPWWSRMGREFAEQILGHVDPENYPLIRDATVRVTPCLFPEFLDVFREQSPTNRHYWASVFLKALTEGKPDLSAEVVLEARTDEFLAFMAPISPNHAAAMHVFRRELDRRPEPDWDVSTLEEVNSPHYNETQRDELASRQANAALALLYLGKADEFWPQLRFRPDPRVRSYILSRMRVVSQCAPILIDRLESTTDVSILRAITLGVGEVPLSDIQVDQVTPMLVKFATSHEDSGVRSAAEWVLRKLGRELETSQLKPPESANWSLEAHGHVMYVVRTPTDFLCGANVREKPRLAGEAMHLRKIRRGFAVSIKTVTRGHYRQFLEEFPELRRAERFAQVDEHPQCSVQWFDAAAYCNWLSREAGLPEDEWCYVANGDGKYESGMRLAPDFLERIGFRLPTEEEWEYVCRAGTNTLRHYGHSFELLDRYAYLDQESLVAQRVGRLRPNEFGMFDTHGNLREWCQDERIENDAVRISSSSEDFLPVVLNTSERVLRGSSYYYTRKGVTCANRHSHQADIHTFDIGFRVARTLPMSP